jgi:SSS family transporter
LNGLDWLIVFTYLGALIIGSHYLGRNQKGVKDYFLGSRSLPWWSVGLSVMATQLGAISFVSAPAFVGLKAGGGLKWLAYEFAVPLSAIFLIMVIIPPLYSRGIVSIYAYLEERFGPSTRLLMSAIFLISRGLATGVAIYTVALVLAPTLQIPFWLVLLVIGLVTMVYDTLGGMRAVVWSDVCQMIILSIGIVAVGWFAWHLVGGLRGAAEVLEPWRFQVVDFAGHGFGDGKDYAFWPMLLGGFFLYVAYYGCDQSQAQRLLSAPSLYQAQKAVFMNGLLRFPIVLLYSGAGLLIGAFIVTQPEFFSAMQEKGAAYGIANTEDLMVPIFILNYLPHGLIGIIIVSILAASMSSLDSAINSLSAATVRDFYLRFRPQRDDLRLVWISRGFTVFWGLFCTGFAFAVKYIPGTVIEIINAIGAVFYGPLAATFVLAIWADGIGSRSVNLGIALGVIVNVFLWLDSFMGLGLLGVSWLWYSLIGFAITFGVAFLAPRQQKVSPKVISPLEEGGIGPRIPWALALYFGLIVAFTLVISKIL